MAPCFGLVTTKFHTKSVAFDHRPLTSAEAERLKEL